MTLSLTLLILRVKVLDPSSVKSLRVKWFQTFQRYTECHRNEEYIIWLSLDIFLVGMRSLLEKDFYVPLA